MMPNKLHRYLATIVVLAVISFSFAVFALGSAGVLPTAGIWRALVIPAYIPMLLSAVVATSLSLPASPMLVVAAIVVTILPFVALDWSRARHRQPPVLPNEEL